MNKELDEKLCKNEKSIRCSYNFPGIGLYHDSIVVILPPKSKLNKKYANPPVILKKS
jgi:hypothetical protein